MARSAAIELPVPDEEPPTSRDGSYGFLVVPVREEVENQDVAWKLSAKLGRFLYEKRGESASLETGWKGDGCRALGTVTELYWGHKLGLGHRLMDLGSHRTVQDMFEDSYVPSLSRHISAFKYQ